MTPPPDFEAACSGCFLHERTGGTCPMVRSGYDPDAAEARRRAAALHLAVLADAQDVPALAELVRRDAASQVGLLPAATRLGLLLPAPVANSPVPNSQKEAVRVLVARTTE